MERVLYEVKRVIVGQDHLLERLVVALLARGHLLVEGVPGLAKTMAIKTLAAAVGGEFQAHPVHARPGARRPRRDAHLQPEDRRVQHLARSGLHQPPPRRRDQPRARQGAERAAGGDAGAPGDDRPRRAHPCPIRSWCWPPRTPSRPRAPTPCPRRRSTASCSRCWSVTRRRPRNSYRRAQTGPAETVQEVLSTRGAAGPPAAGRPGLRRPLALRLRGAPGDRDACAGGLRHARHRPLHHLRRQPARLDQPDPHGPRPGLRARPRLHPAAGRAATWPST